MITKKWEDIVHCCILALSGFFLLFDLYFNIGQPAHMDGITHITTIAQYARAFGDGDIKVLWTDGFANYGLPLGIMAHQVTSYMGGIIDLFLHKAVWSFNTVYFIGALLSLVAFYAFLRLYFKPTAAFAGAFLFQFAPYRVLNLYIRGAQPEFFTSLFLPLILISVYQVVYNRHTLFIPLTALFFGLLILTHPMVAIVYAPVIILYIALTCWFHKRTFKLMVALYAALLYGGLLAAYFIVPLLFETKYFYYGLTKNHLTPNQYLSIKNFIDPNWYYYYRNDIFHRGHFIKAGLFEFVVFASGLLYTLWLLPRWKHFNKQTALFVGATGAGLLYLIFTTRLSAYLYETISFLGNIQFPWRMMSGFIFIPPVLCAFFFERVRSYIPIVVFVAFITLIRFPQLYGKNYTAIPEQSYYFTPFNLHSINMNTIWSVQSELYPIKRDKGEIIAGQGKILSRVLKNSWRAYEVEAKDTVRMADYTFYFPGWWVYVDGKKTEIEFQDERYKGVITYYVPPGRHTVKVQFEETKTRLLGDAISVIAVVALLAIFIVEYRYNFFKKFI